MSFKSMAALVAIVAAASSSSVASAEDLPTRKPGLWETSMSKKSDEGAGPVTPVRQCVDAETDKIALLGANKGMCDTAWKRVAGDRIETETKCKMGPIVVEGKGVITGDFNANIHMETTTTTTALSEGAAANTPKLNIPSTTQTMLIETKWLGPCEAGQKPGDVIMPDGKIIHVPTPAK